MHRPPKKLLEKARDIIRVKHYSFKTEKSYLSWMKRYILYHEKRHPKEMGKVEIESFLTHLALDRKVSSSTQNQAFNAILFLYREVLKLEIENGINSVRAKRHARLPTVMTKDEAISVINLMSGDSQLVAKLLYSGGLRLMESLRLRVKDIEFSMNQVIVRDGKGAKDRVTVLAENLKQDLKAHLKKVQTINPMGTEGNFRPKSQPGGCSYNLCIRFVVNKPVMLPKSLF